ncbi:MAG: serine/threonine protein kinase [Planctomycetia bacterium]|nr:serine/threonine protein kinase [Planctomycetia bacterium]
MTAQPYARVKALFLEVCDLDPPARAAVLDRQCAGNPALRAEVESLLAHHAQQTVLADQGRETTVATLAGRGRPGVVRVVARQLLARLLQNKGWNAAALAALLALVAGGFWSEWGIERALQGRLAESISTVLDADVTALDVWLSDRKSLAQRWANQPDMRTLVTALLQAARDTNESHDALLAAPELARLRKLLAWYVEEPGNVGYAIVDRAGLIVASGDDQQIGRRLNAAGLAEHAQVLAGQTRVLTPHPEGTLTGDGDAVGDAPMIWVGAPVHDDAGKVVAVLGLGVRADQQFTRILSVARLGRTGETYAFDDRGTLLSESRFDEQLKAIGLVPDDPLARSTFRVQVRDPGVNLVAGAAASMPPAARPLTKMAALAVAGEDGVDVDGYRDYRGVPVVGAWKWLPEYGFGVATEVDYDEAYAPLWYPMMAARLTLAVLLAALAGLLYSAIRIVSLRKQVGVESRLGQYTLAEKIGEGGMGVVYRARHAMLQRPTAVKLLKPELETAAGIARFEREVQLASQLSHPNTIEIYDYGRTPEGVFYYAMEYLSGVTLAGLVAVEGALPPARVRAIVDQVCGSLAEAHGVGLIHRDIKPHNVMLCERGGVADFVKVLDFGLVKRLGGNPRDTLSAAGMLAGTPLYLAPELLQDPRAADARTDIYALGGVMYKLLTGDDVFECVSDLDMLYKVASAVPAPPSARNPEVPAQLDRLVLACLAKDPHDRPQSVTEIVRAFAEIPGIGTWTQENARAWWLTPQAPPAPRPAAAVQAESRSAATRAL